jgi:hypothetical protein
VPKRAVEEPLAAELQRKLAWGLETTLAGRGYRPRRDEVDDWAERQAEDIEVNLPDYVRGIEDHRHAHHITQEVVNREVEKVAREG